MSYGALGAIGTYFGNKALVNPIEKMKKKGRVDAPDLRKSTSSDIGVNEARDVTVDVSQDGHKANANKNPKNDTHGKSFISKMSNSNIFTETMQAFESSSMAKWGGFTPKLEK